MKTLNLYVTRSFVITFVMTMGILTFGLLGARLVKIFELLSKGVPLIVAGEFIVYTLPVVLTMTIPWATLVSVMLVFGRLSADSEITAMRACGISILQIISPIMLIAIFMSGLCLLLQADVGPSFLGKARDAIRHVGVSQPLALLDPGRPIDFDNMHIIFDDRVGEDEIRGVQIYNLHPETREIQQDITASRGKIVADEEKQILSITLYNCTVIDYSGASVQRLLNDESTININYGEEFNSYNIFPRVKYMSFRQIFGCMRIYNERKFDTTALEVELNQRLAFSIAPIAFVLFGLPLAIRTSRRETSIGLFLSVITMGMYFMSIIICDSLTDYPKLYPQYLLWIPVVLFQGAGILMIGRIARR